MYAQQEPYTAPASLQEQPSTNLHRLDDQNSTSTFARSFTSSPFDRSFTAGSTQEQDLYALPAGARHGRLEASIDAEISPAPDLAEGYTAADMTTEETMAGADASQWHHYADLQGQTSCVSSAQSSAPSHMRAVPNREYRAHAGLDAESDLRSLDQSLDWSQQEQMLLSSTRPPASPSAASNAWLELSSPTVRATSSSTGPVGSALHSIALPSVDNVHPDAASGNGPMPMSSSRPQRAALQAWSQSGAQADANFRSWAGDGTQWPTARSRVDNEALLPATRSWGSLAELQDHGPHPPEVLSMHGTLVSAPSGFRGHKGVSGDPRLRRFREADTAGMSKQ